MTDPNNRFAVRVAADTFRFSAAHFLVLPDGAREPLHGHDYRVSLEVTGTLDATGLLADFVEMERQLARICGELDHSVLVPERLACVTVREEGASVVLLHGDERLAIPRRDVALLPIASTSTEDLARHVSHRVRAELGEVDPDGRLDALTVTVEEGGGRSASHFWRP